MYLYIYLLLFFSFLYCCCCYCRVFFTWISFKLLFLFEIISFLGCVFFLPYLCYSPLNTIDLYCPVHCLLLFLVFLVESQLLFCEEVYCFAFYFFCLFFLLFSGPLFFEIFSRYLLFVSFSIIIVIILFWDIKISLNSLFSF